MKSNVIALGAIIFLWNLTGLKAQETIPTSGGEASGMGGTTSYTIGQVAYSTYSGSNGFVAEGVQQPYEISVVTGIEGTTQITLNVSTYPNPTTDFVILNIENLSKYPLSYRLFDLTGKEIKHAAISSTKTQINMNKLLPSIYFLRIMNLNKEIKLFKIIKL